MLRTSASTDMAAATAEYNCVMSATTARGSPCSRRRSDHRIRAGDDPDPIINAAGAPSTVTWQAASRSGFMCLVPDTSSNTSCPATGGRSRTAVTVSSRNQAACVASSGTTRKPPPKGTTADADRTGAPSLKRSRSTLKTSMSTSPTFQSFPRTAHLLGAAAGPAVPPASGRTVEPASNSSRQTIFRLTSDAGRFERSGWATSSWSTTRFLPIDTSAAPLGVRSSAIRARGSGGMSARMSSWQP